MIVARSKILQYMAEGIIGIAPFDSTLLNPNSYDVTLGEWFYRVALVDGDWAYFGPKRFAVGEKVPLEYGVGLLGMTAERILTATPVVGQLRAKSTTGRQFWTVCQDAGWGDLDYDNHWTAEFSLHLFGTAYLTVGQKFGQMVFTVADVSDNERGYDGQYSIDEWPICMVPKAYRDKVRPWDDFENHRQSTFLFRM